MHKTGLLVLLVLILAACNGAASPTEPTAAQVVIVKQIVTVEIPPSPNPAERRATLDALPRTPTAAAATPTPTETPYVGVFIGEVEMSGGVFQPPVAAATRQTSDCVIPIDAAFGEGWRSNPSIARQMGCPIQERFGFAGEVQVFEGGVMYHRTDANAVWAVTPGNLNPGRYWYIETPPVIEVQGVTPPQGLRVPSETLGSVWFTTPELRDTLGFARTPQQVADMNIQRFEGGTLFLDVTVGQVFVLLANGDAYGPY